MVGIFHRYVSHNQMVSHFLDDTRSHQHTSMAFRIHHDPQTLKNALARSGEKASVNEHLETVAVPCTSK